MMICPFDQTLKVTGVLLVDLMAYHGISCENIDGPRDSLDGLTATTMGDGWSFPIKKMDDELGFIVGSITLSIKVNRRVRDL